MVDNINLLISCTTIGAAVIGVFVGVIMGVTFTVKILRRRSKIGESTNEVQLTAGGLPSPIYEEINLNTFEQVELSCNFAYDTARKATLS